MKDLDSLHRYIDDHFRKLFGEQKQARVGMLGTERKTYVGLGMPQGCAQIERLQAMVATMDRLMAALGQSASFAKWRGWEGNCVQAKFMAGRSTLTTFVCVGYGLAQQDV